MGNTTKKRSWRDRGDYGNGSLLKSADFSEEGDRCTIVEIDAEDVFGTQKLVAVIEGDVEGRIALNATNCQKLERLAGSDDPDDWCGIAALFYNDADVRNPDGRVVGGIRIRPAKPDKKSQPAQRRRPKRKFEDQVDDLLEDDE